MIKRIYPLLILIGLVRGIYWLVRKYRPTMAPSPNHFKKVIIGTAVFVIGLFGLAGCKKDRKPVVTCYSPQTVEKIQKNALMGFYPVSSLEKALEGLKTAQALNEFTAKMVRLMFGQSAFPR